MYQFHGWITLSNASCDATQLDDECFEDKLTWLKAELNSQELLTTKLELLIISDQHVLTLHAHVNRRRAEAELMADFVQRVAKKFECSTGLIYEFDDTQIAGGHGLYTVTVVEKGRAYYRLDPFLSPAELNSPEDVAWIKTLTEED